VESSHGKKKGMVLPFEPHSITFDEVVYSVDMPQVNHIQRYKFSIWISNSFYLKSTSARGNLCF